MKGGSIIMADWDHLGGGVEGTQQKKKKKKKGGKTGMLLQEVLYEME